MRKLNERGETLGSFVFRDATIDDIRNLGTLHAETWAQTYNASTVNYELRQSQWNKAFMEENDGSWFCILVADGNNKLIGFAKGIRNDHAEYKGELNKLYLLKEYQRVGLGSKLISQVAMRFISMGIYSMSCYVDPNNPSCRFFEKIGGQWLREPNGELNYSWYVWSDITPLAGKQEYPPSMHG